MRKTLKRTLSLFLAVLLICTVLTVAPFSAGALNGTVAGTINANSSQTVYVQGANIKFLKLIREEKKRKTQSAKRIINKQKSTCLMQVDFCLFCFDKFNNLLWNCNSVT